VTRADELIRDLGLKPHPEGGWYAEVFRSASRVAPEDGRGDRPALTTIYFLLTRGQRSRLHRVLSDEVWHFYEGDPLRLTVCDAAFANLEDIALGRFDNTSKPVYVVPAGAWQAAATTGDYTLVGCTVGPGFDFADFAMLKDDPAQAADFMRLHPNRTDLV
jgi:predicted cupin superfamily sugar epimerase